ncbi:MAG: hypothetical protein VYE18_09845 [Pseudomonadota bacterium]|nr:hypothetical protein [Pseudomonadota bacterium]
MVSQIIGAADQAFVIQPPGPVRQASTQGVLGNSEDYKPKTFKLFGDDGFTFRDFLDMINPLHHIPVVGTLYRSITGDQLDPGAKMFGSTVLGGPIGAVASIIDVAIKHNTGKDIGEHTIAMFTDKDGGGDAPLNTADVPTEMAGVRARVPVGTPMGAEKIEPAPTVSDVNILRVGAPPTPGRDFSTAGMSAIPQISPKRVAGTLDRFIPTVAPDLQALADFKTSAGPVEANAVLAKAATSDKPLALEPIYTLDEKPASVPAARSVFPDEPKMPVVKLSPQPQARNPEATATRQLAVVEQILADGKQGWLTQTMIGALEKYESGRRFNSSRPPITSVLR